MAALPHPVGLDAALSMLLGGSKGPAGGLHPPGAGQPAGHLQHVAPFSLPAPLQPAASEELITPVNAEANPAAALLLGAGAPPALPPPAPARCLLCNGVGSSGACGPLRPVTVEGQQAVVHDQCAVWSPGCYLPEGSSTYVNLESEYRRARHRTCSACGQPGAAVPCSHPWCRCAYHLPCALGAPGVLLEADTFEAWCPLHADGEGSDEDYTAAAPARPRRQPGSSAGAAKRPRASTEAQRPRTDWQKKDENTWLKVVPPWWCEQRTVHFATKVYKELFRSAGSAVLVDPTGGQWLCLVQTEARNDNRPQYTLRGAFAELWEAQGISSGDTLIFRRDPMTGHIDLGRHAAGSGAAAGARMEEAASELSELSGGEVSGARPTQRRARQEASSDRGASQQGSHPNRWMELADGWAVKTVYKSTLAHQQCPIAGWLFKKLYGRLPGEADRAPAYDPDLDAEYRFDVAFIAAANVHYLTGRTFSGWMREAGLQAGEQIRMRREPATGRVVIQRMPADRKVRVDFTTKAASRSTASLAALGGGGDGAVLVAPGGMPAGLTIDLASPPTAEALEALDALVAAAGYAGTHGTPAIHAALAAAGGGGAAAAAAALNASLPAPKRQRTADGSDAAAALLADTEAAVLAARRDGGGDGPSSAAPFSLADWQPSAPHVQMFTAITGILAAHQWSEAEQAELLRFRAKYAWLDACGREVAYLTCSQLRSDRAGLLEFVRAAGQGILTAVPGQGPQGVQFQPAGAGARVSPFAAAATPGGDVALGAAGAQLAGPTASSPAPPAAQQQQQAQQQAQQQELQQEQREQEAGGGGGMPGIASLLEMHNAGVEEAMQALEGAASFNLDAAYFASHAAPPTAVKVEAEEVEGHAHVPTPH